MSKRELTEACIAADAVNYRRVARAPRKRATDR